MQSMLLQARVGARGWAMLEAIMELRFSLLPSLHLEHVDSVAMYASDSGAVDKSTEPT